MAYTIIEVEKLTGISSHTLRFWAKKGLFPFVQKDSNQVKYFANSDVEWAKLIECMRIVGMSIEDISHYIALCQKGIESVEERREMLLSQKKQTQEKILSLTQSLSHLENKIAYYDEMIKQSKDPLNPLTSETPNQCWKKIKK